MEEFHSVELSPEFVQGFRSKIISAHPLRDLGDKLNCSLPPLFGCRSYGGRISDTKEVSLQCITESFHIQICKGVIQSSGTEDFVRVSIETVKMAEFLANS
jgi:hypothetical protein